MIQWESKIEDGPAEQHAGYARQQTALADLAIAALRAEDLSALLELVTRLIVEALEVDLAAVMELLPDGRTLILRAGHGWSEGLVGQMMLDVDTRSQAGFTLLAGRSVLFDDLATETRFTPTPMLLDHGVVSGATVIIEGTDRPFGVLGCHARAVRQFTADEVRFLQAAANVVATTVRRRRAEEALQESEARNRAILETAVDGIVTIDEHGLIESFNASAERLFGYRAHEVIGRNVSLLMPQTVPAAAAATAAVAGDGAGAVAGRLGSGEALAAAAAHVVGTEREVTGRRRDGSTFPMEVTVSEMRLGNRRLFTGMVRDHTDRKRMERELLNISEREQRRLGQDLHDGLGQQLAGIGFMVKSLAQRLTGAGATEAAEAERIAGLVSEAIAQARAMARGLHPVAPDPDGLELALRDMCGHMGQLFRLRCEFLCPRPVRLADPQTATHLFRIAQEATNNATKHGNAARITVHLARSPVVSAAVSPGGGDGAEELLTLTVEDDGVGLPEQLSPARGRGLGLQIMHYRAATVGGALAVRRNPLGGTTVTCTCPYRPPPVAAGRGEP